MKLEIGFLRAFALYEFAFLSGTTVGTGVGMAFSAIGILIFFTAPYARQQDRS